MSDTTISPEDFVFVQNIVRETAGIVLDVGKEYLVESRLVPLAKREGYDSLDVLIGKLRSQPQNGLLPQVVEAMTTNETSFFRDVHPFEVLKEMIEDLRTKVPAGQNLNIWSAACSSGQEPYTIGMTAKEILPEEEHGRIKVLATDLSEEILDKARSGTYSKLEINRGLPATYLVKYFKANGSQWEIVSAVKNMIRFQPLNLIGDWPLFPMMDIIFLRNVMIYFDRETKSAILKKMYSLMKPTSYLFLGAAETTINLNTDFRVAKLGRATCYQVQQ